MFYVAHRLFAAHDRALGALVAQRLGSLVGPHEVFLPFCDTDEENLVAEMKGRRLYELDRERLSSLDGMLAVLHGPSLDDGTCMEIGYAAALGVPVVVLTTDFQTYGHREQGTQLHFPDALIEVVVTEIVRVDHLTPTSGTGTRFEVFHDRNVTQLADCVSLAAERLVEHAQPTPEPKPFIARTAGALAVCERSPHYDGADWGPTIRLLESHGYCVRQSQRIDAANPVATAWHDWNEVLGCQLLVVDTTGPETPCGAAVLIGAATALGRRVIAWHPTPSWTFAPGREPNWRNLMIQYSVDARVGEIGKLKSLVEP